jgi:hypothetical protein
MPSLLHRWFVRSGTRWVLVAWMSLALVGAQTLAARHELSHLFAGSAGSVGSVGSERVAEAAVAPDGAGHPASLPASHECPLCLLAAALGGTAAGPHGLTFCAAASVMPGPCVPGHVWTPRFLRGYASRAPPRA